MNPADTRIVFMGTPPFAVASLDALVKAGFTISAVVTAPDKPAGRGLQLQQSAVKKYAVENNLPVLQPVKLKDQLCYGWNLAGTDKEVLQKVDGKIQLSYLLNAYKLFPEKEKFFITPKSGKPTDYFFNKLAGNDALQKQIIAGASEKEIRASWKKDIDAFKAIRKKYLLYTDFE